LISDIRIFVQTQIINGKKLKNQKTMDRVPDNVRRYLEAYAVEKQSLDHYDQVIQNEEDQNGTNLTG
jgi:cytidylate kinase